MSHVQPLAEPVEPRRTSRRRRQTDRGCRARGRPGSVGDHAHRRDEVPPRVARERPVRARRARRRREPAAGAQREGAASSGPLPGLRWHFIGQAQTNKARAIRAAASVVHSVDRARIADALDAAAGRRRSRAGRAAAGQPHRRPGARRGRARTTLESLAEHVGRMPHPARAGSHGRRAARRAACGRVRSGCGPTPTAFARSCRTRTGSPPG